MALTSEGHCIVKQENIRPVLLVESETQAERRVRTCHITRGFQLFDIHVTVNDNHRLEGS